MYAMEPLGGSVVSLPFVLVCKLSSDAGSDFILWHSRSGFQILPGKHLILTDSLTSLSTTQKKKHE